MVIEKAINPRFENFIFDWDYKTYLMLGGYGSSKSYHIALKLVLKLMKEKRKALVVREVYETLKDSCYDLIYEILSDMGMISETASVTTGKVVCTVSPLQFRFPNGSKIIFRGMDKPERLKSINDVSIVWLEEASEIKYKGYKEITGRVRSSSMKIYFFLSSNPVNTDNWLYKHFFKRKDDDGNDIIILDDKVLYKQKTAVKNDVYYHHSLPEDNLFLPTSYIKTLDELKTYDDDLYRVARLGEFGVSGRKVLPQFEARTHAEVMKEVTKIPDNMRFVGMDFGFEESYNAVIKMAVDDKNKILYIYWEYYKNQMTDNETAVELAEYGLKDKIITADCEDPKAIRYFNNCGFQMRKCTKFAGSRLSNIRKIKRFKKIICSTNCPNCVRELKTLVYHEDKNGNKVYDQFNIDPHTFSAIWYGLDKYTVADIKEKKFNSFKGA